MLHQEQSGNPALTMEYCFFFCCLNHFFNGGSCRRDVCTYLLDLMKSSSDFLLSATLVQFRQDVVSAARGQGDQMQGCQIFLGTTYQKREETYQITTKWPYNLPI
jgi:hypothetical protein